MMTTANQKHLKMRIVVVVFVAIVVVVVVERYCAEIVGYFAFLHVAVVEVFRVGVLLAVAVAECGCKTVADNCTDADVVVVDVDVVAAADADECMIQNQCLPLRPSLTTKNDRKQQKTVVINEKKL
jgi:hypothetical protein